MTAQTAASRHFFAIDCPRGFANENAIHVFTSAASRDAYVADRTTARVATRKACAALARRKDDAATKQYVAMYLDGAQIYYREDYLARFG